MANEMKRESRQDREEWLKNQFQETESTIVFRGGPETPDLAREALQAYKYGLFRATLILGCSVIEHLLITLLLLKTHKYDYDEDKFDFPPLKNAADEAREEGIIDEEYDLIDNARTARNAFVHYRNVTHGDSPTWSGLEDRWDELEERIEDSEDEVEIEPFDMDLQTKESAQKAIEAMLLLNAKAWGASSA